MKIAIEGCCHGELDNIYRGIQQLEQKNGYKVNVLLICGDFQAMRNEADLEVMACPPKYRALHDFHKYYTGEKKAPVLTLVIGGNHEASNYMWELYHGGWLAPNIYFLGHAGCVQVNGVRIAGASGIFKRHDFPLGHYETTPYDNSTMRSIYHIREFCVRKLSLLSSPHIFLSHDWPQSIEQHGDVKGLLRRKKYFADDIAKGALGSPPLMHLLMTLKPEWWFAAHLHVRFEATVSHGGREKRAGREVHEKIGGVKNPDEIMIDDDEEAEAAMQPVEVVRNPDEILIDEEDEVEAAVQAAVLPETNPVPQPLLPQLLSRNPDEITLSDEEELTVAPPAPPPHAPQAATASTSSTSAPHAAAGEYRETKFLSLDKCLPNRHFLEVIDVPLPSSSSNPKESSTPLLTYDPEWLAITRAFHPWFSRTRYQRPFPPEDEARAMVTREIEWVRENVLKDAGELAVEECQQFGITAPGPGKEGGRKGRMQQPPYYPNPQTDVFCRMLGIESKLGPGAAHAGANGGGGGVSAPEAEVSGVGGP